MSTETVELTIEQLSNRVAWVKALISGEYAQGNGLLKVPNVTEHGVTYSSYCCLGVAALCIGGDVNAVGESQAFLKADWANEHYGMSGVLTFDVKNNPEDQVVAARWNDKFGFSFDEIADRVALATDTLAPFHVIDADSENPRDHEEFAGLNAGDYARQWVERMENNDHA